MQHDRRQKRDDSRIIIHFDYDAFYASVVENENPALKSVPLAIQQKQIVVTCNYEARRRGLHKLQLITEAKRICPDAVIILGEDLTRFRNASKDLYGFLRGYIWSDKAERLGFDEVWLDCTDMIDYNCVLLNQHDLSHSFFCIDKDDPTRGFEFDASKTFGPTFPAHASSKINLDEGDRVLHSRLVLGSHLARFLRHELESQKGYTATVGIATNKILSKLIGNVNKPKNQTTLMPPLNDELEEGSIHQFMDKHDVGKVPGIGFKLGQKIRALVLGRNADHEEGLVYGGTKENVTVRDVRLHPLVNSEKLEEVLGGPGAQKGVGGRVWDLLNGYDDTEVSKAKRVPSQISQEDSYMKYLQTFEQVRQQLYLLSERLIRRMQIDLMEDADMEDQSDKLAGRRWLAHPRTLRLTTRPRPPLKADGTRVRSFNRISHSAPMPSFVLNVSESTSALADRLVDATLISMFRKLHPERNGWNLSLMNIAATNMAETAADNKGSEGRDIGRMFRRQEDVLREFKVSEEEHEDGRMGVINVGADTNVDRDRRYSDSSRSESAQDGGWENDHEAEAEAEEANVDRCSICGMQLPTFAVEAHYRYHSLAEDLEPQY